MRTAEIQMRTPFTTVHIRSLVESIETWNPGRTDGEVTFDYIDLSSVDSDKKEIVGARTLACNEAPSRARQLVATKDVLVSTVRPNLNGVAFVPDELDGATASTGFCVLRSDRTKLHARYLFHWVTAPRFVSTMVKLATGASYPAVSDRIILDSQIPVPYKNGKPDLNEQKRIAAILDKADAIRRKLQQSLRLSDDFLRSVFLDMFGDPVTNPKGWPLPRLGELCDVRDGTHDSPKYVAKGRALLTSKNFKDGTIDETGANHISETDFIQINKRSKVDKGDLVMPMIGTVGNPVLVDRDPDFAIKNVALIKFGKESPDNRFIRELLCSHYFDHIMEGANRGGNQKFVALSDLRRMPIPLPPDLNQRKFAAIVKSVEKQKSNFAEQLANSNSLFSSLQQRAFRGEL